MENEIWKVYKETNCNRLGRRVYEVSNQGHVKINGELIDIKPAIKGYPAIGGFYIHRAVAELFIPNPKNKPCVDHIDTDTNNNNYLNLRWVSQAENNRNPLTRKHLSESHIGHNLASETKLKLSIFLERETKRYKWSYSNKSDKKIYIRNTKRIYMGKY